MPDHNHREPSLDLAASLDRHWDALMRGAAGDLDLEQLDPTLAATTRRISRLDAAPSPHPRFATMLWEDLMQAQTASPELAGPPAAPLHVRSLPGNGRWFTASPAPLSRIAAAILLIVLLAGSAFAALYPLRQHDRDGLPLAAPSGTHLAELGDLEGAMLLNMTLSDLPTMRTQGGMDVTEYPPGGSSQELTFTSTDVLYVAVGPMALTVVKAAQPVQVMRPTGAGYVEPGDLLEQGQETTLETGTALALPPETIIELVNPGSAPTRMLDLISTLASSNSERGGATWRWGSIGNEQALAPPVSVVLRQVSLDAGATLPVPDSTATGLSAAVLDADRVRDVRFDANRGWHNASDEPTDLYVLHVTSNAEAAAPGAPAVEAAGVPVDFEFLWQSMGGSEPRSRLSDPYGLGLDLEGNVWVANGSYNRFQVIAPDGTFVATWGDAGSDEGEFSFYSNGSGFARGYGDVAFDADGNIYVADTGNTRVQKFAPDRSLLLAWGSEGQGDGQFITPSGIAIAADGTVYVSDQGRSDVQMFDAEGRFLGTIGTQGSGDGQFLVPSGIGIGPDGDVWVADYSNHRIQRFTSSGEWMDAWGESGSRNGELIAPSDVAVDQLGRVYVADDGNSRLQIFSSDGQFLAAIGSFGTKPGQFSDAFGVAVGEDGTIYVSGMNGLQAFRLVPGKWRPDEPIAWSDGAGRTRPPAAGEVDA